MKRILMLLSLLILNLNINSITNNLDFEKYSTEERLKKLKLMAILNPRKLLGLNQIKNLTLDKVKNTYKKLALIWHPDKNKSPKSGYIFDCINLAYKNITNRVKICGDLIEKREKSAEYKFFKTLVKVLYKNKNELNFLDRHVISLSKDIKIENSGDYIFINLANNVLSDQEKLLNKVFAIKNWELNIKLILLNSDLIKAVFTDFINILNELNRIRVLANKDTQSIKNAAIIGKVRNTLSITELSIYIFNLGLKSSLDNLFKNLGFTVDNYSKLDKLADLLDLFPGLCAFQFLAKDNKIIKNAEKIAAYNKDNNINLKSTKLKQIAWLAINKIAPYLGFAFIRRNEDKASLDKIFNLKKIAQSPNFLNLYKAFHIIKSFSNISEIARKHYRYKAELSSIK